MSRLIRNQDNQYNLTLTDRPEGEEEKASLLRELSSFRRIDPAYLIVSLLLVCYGLIVLFSASMSTAFATQGDNSTYYFMRQAGYSLGGLAIGLAVASFVNINFFRKKGFYFIAYGLTSVFLLMVFVAGTTQLGAQRWLYIGSIGFQPSEVAKFMSIYVLSGYFSEVMARKKRGHFRAKDSKQQFWLDGRILFLYPVAIVAFWFILILIQPHLSGAIIFAACCFMVFIAAKIPWRAWLSGLIQLFPIVLAGLLILGLVFPLIKGGQSLPEYIQERFAHSTQRIETFTEAEGLSEDQVYQTKQAEITMGSGGFTGLGLGKGRQKYNYLPQIHNDYIFPAIAEELGYVGTMLVLLLFIVQYLLGVRISLKSRSLFASLIAWGFSFLLILQVALNVGVAAEVIPATGITLPFFSYGGTSNIIFLIEVGMVLCVSRTGQKENELIRYSIRPAERG